jgi:hypothetical protein
MKNIIMALDSIYQKEKIKKIYTYTLSGITIVLIMVIPTFTINRNLIGSFFIDFLVRSFITYSFCNLYYFVSHLEKYYEKFYSGADMSNDPAPDELKQVINVITALFVGACGFFFLQKIMVYFLAEFRFGGIIISFIIGFFLFLPVISQYKKR